MALLVGKAYNIADRHPLKQGLKLLWKSNFTRLQCYRRPTSIKTRIETLNVFVLQLTNVFIADRHPLKQGLKLNMTIDVKNGKEIADRHPLKQGLKLCYSPPFSSLYTYRRPTSIKTRIETW